MTNERARARALCMNTMMNEYDGNIVSLLSKLFTYVRKGSLDHIVLFKQKFIPNPQQQQEEEAVKRRPLLDLSATAAGKERE